MSILVRRRKVDGKGRAIGLTFVILLRKHRVSSTTTSLAADPLQQRHPTRQQHSERPVMTADSTTFAPSPSRIVLPPLPAPPPPSASSPPGIHIGVLALQGAFVEHLNHLRRLSSSRTLPYPIVAKPVRTANELTDLHGLIIPGGESTAISLLASRQPSPTPQHPTATFMDHLRSFVRTCNEGGGRSTWGTCAGMILLADEVVEGSMKRGGQEVIGGLGIKVVRNQWGRQVRSCPPERSLRRC